MKIRILSLSAPTKASALASAKIEIQIGSDQKIVVDDLRVLQNANGELWVAFPSRMINGSYTQLLFVSHDLKRLIEDAVVPAYQVWAAAQAAKGGVA